MANSLIVITVINYTFVNDTESAYTWRVLITFSWMKSMQLASINICKLTIVPWIHAHEHWTQTQPFPCYFLAVSLFPPTNNFFVLRNNSQFSVFSLPSKSWLFYNVQIAVSNSSLTKRRNFTRPEFRRKWQHQYQSQYKLIEIDWLTFH